MPRNPFEVIGQDPETQIDQPVSEEENAQLQPPEKPDFLGDIPVANWKPKRRIDTRQRGPVLFVRNIDHLKEPLAKIAEQMDVPRDMLVRYLLEEGIRSHLSGEDQLVSVFNQRLTLYPNETPPRKKRNRKSKGVGFRGIPPQTRQQLDEIISSLCVPAWQVVRRMLESGISDYRAGTLNIEPQEIQTVEYTLYPDE